MTKRYRWTVLIILACLIIWSLAIKGGICTFTHTSLAGAGQSSSSEQCCISNHSYDPPAIYFHDADGTIMDAKETQLMLNDKGHTDKDGNVLDVDGVWGPKTIYAVNQYVGDCHGNETFNTNDLFGRTEGWQRK